MSEPLLPEFKNFIERMKASTHSAALNAWAIFTKGEATKPAGHTGWVEDGTVRLPGGQFLVLLGLGPGEGLRGLVNVLLEHAAIPEQNRVHLVQI